MFFSNKLNDVIVDVALKELKEITTNIVLKNITREKLQEITIEELIVANKNKNDEITDIDFKLNRAYEVLLDIKGNLEKEILALKKGMVPENTIVVKDNLIIKIPYYSYTNNVVFMNMGPKIFIKINLLENVIGDVYTKVSSYGINSVLINLYIKIYVTESLLLPSKIEKNELEFEIFVDSKIIQGKIPSFYNGVLESTSPIINTK